MATLFPDTGERYFSMAEWFPAGGAAVTLAAPRHGSAPVESLARLVGSTPLVRLRRVGADLPGCPVYAKCEFMNPGGSVKDRAALRMIEGALAAGRLGPERTLVDSTSGNTGVAYAWICAALGLRCALVMPRNVSAARKLITRAYGAELVFSDPLEGSDGAIHHVRGLVEAEPGRWFYPDQYGNEENPRAHELGTAVEIAEALDGRVAAFVAGIGTGGTVMGTSRGLRALAPGVRCFAVEPAEPLHGLEGLKHMATSIVPAIYREAELDGKLSIADRRRLGHGRAARPRGGAARRPLGRRRGGGRAGGGAAAGRGRPGRQRGDGAARPGRPLPRAAPLGSEDRVVSGVAYGPELLARLAALCEAEPEREVCGFVVRRGGALEAVEIRNVADAYHAHDPVHFPRTSRESYLMDPRAQLRLHEALDREGGVIVAVWHSHVEVGAYFSAKDRADAVVDGVQLVPGAEYLVLGVRGGRVDEVRRYVWRGGEFAEEAVT